MPLAFIFDPLIKRRFMIRILISIWAFCTLVPLANAQIFAPPMPAEPPQEAVDFMANNYPKATRLEWRNLQKGFKATFNEPVGPDEPTLNPDAEAYFDEAGKWKLTLWRNRYGKACKDSLDQPSLKQIEKHSKGKSNYFEQGWIRRAECLECYQDRKTKKPITKTWAMTNIEGITIFDHLGNYISFEPKQLEF